MGAFGMNKSNNQIIYSHLNQALDTIQNRVRTTENGGFMGFYNASADYKHIFKKEKEELTANLSYYGGLGSNDNAYHNWSKTGETITETTDYQTSNNSYNHYSAQADYYNKFTKDSKLEVGVKAEYSEDKKLDCNFNENKEEIYAEKKNYWYIKAFELDSSFINIEWAAWPVIEGSASFCSLFDLGSEVDYFNPFYLTPQLKKADSECLNSWGCRYAEQGIECNNKEYMSNACYLFKLSNSNESKISLYHIYANGLGVKKNLKKANSFIKNLPANTPLYAFKSNISEGIKIEKIEEDNDQEQPKK
jgi:hypothetical protein